MNYCENLTVFSYFHPSLGAWYKNWSDGYTGSSQHLLAGSAYSSSGNLCMRDAAMCVIRLTISCHRSALDFLISPILIRGCVPIVSGERLLSPGAFNRSFFGGSSSVADAPSAHAGTVVRRHLRPRRSLTLLKLLGLLKLILGLCLDI